MNQTALLRSTAKNVFAKAGAEIGSRFLGVLFVLLAARALGPDGFGKFTFAAALAPTDRDSAGRSGARNC
jgi:O-antigen/teichoic acid export membrane protein